MKVYDITPVPKPRQTKRDKWLNPPRPCVARYRAFADEVRANKIEIAESGTSIMFVIPMPKSWSNQKKQEMYGDPHRQKPDLDNLIKSLFDSTHEDDCVIYNITAHKIWGDKGQVWIKNA